MLCGLPLLFLIFSSMLIALRAEDNIIRAGEEPTPNATVKDNDNLTRSVAVEFKKEVHFMYLAKFHYQKVYTLPRGKFGSQSEPDDHPDHVQNEEGRNSRRELNKWPNAVVYYAIDNGDRSKLKFSNQDLTYIAASMCRIELYTCIRFRKFMSSTMSPNYTFIQRDTALCNSAVGMVGGEQVVRLKGSDPDGSGSCFDNPGAGSHELLHALGYDHEQQRYDRDEYITYRASNVPEKKQHNFDRVLPASINYAGRYDYFSIMHYSRKSFAADKTMDTMTPKDPNVATFGNRQAMTKRDMDKVNAYYCCTQDATGRWLANGKPVAKTMCPPACPTTAKCRIYYAPYGSQKKTLQVDFENMSTCDANNGKYCKGSTEDFCVLLGNECPNKNAACCPLKKVCNVKDNTLGGCVEDKDLKATCRYDSALQTNICKRCMAMGEVCKYVNDCCGKLECQKTTDEANFTCKAPS